MQKRLDYADKLFRENKYTEAAELFEKLIAESPNCADNPLIRFNLAQSYIVMTQWLKALKELKIAEEGFAKSEHFDDEKKQLLWFMRSMTHEKLNELPFALEYARKASKFDLPQKETIMAKIAQLEGMIDESDVSESTRPSSE
jgi:tetratricopeptide (TPR) repeat protein